MRLYNALLALVLSLAGIVDTQGQWIFNEIGDGTKPSIHAATDNSIHITALKESVSSGFLSYIKVDGQNVMNETVLEDYFYGPIDISTDTSGRPVIAFHHHNVGLNAFRGELAFATQLGPENWTIDIASSEGHDGWDGTLQIDGSNTIHAISNDPANGTEYARLTGGQLMIETIDPQPAMYQYGTDIEIDSEGNIHVTYFTDGNSTLKYAVKINDVWVIEEIDTDAVFPSMILTEDGPVIAYFKAGRNNSLWTTTGQVMVATRVNDTWTSSPVENLSNVSTGIFSGARAIVDIQMTNDGVWHLAFTNDRIIRYGTFDGVGWSLSTILDVSAESYNLGQQVSLDLEDDGTAHIVTFRRIGQDDGIVIYGNNGGVMTTSSIICPEDVILDCAQSITPDNTGLPDTIGGFTNFEFMDTMIQTCPNDVIIQRSWIGFIDGEPSDTCVQMITVTVESIEDFQVEDTITIDEVCIDDLDEIIQMDLELPCIVGIDSVDITTVEQNCERIVYNVNWTFGNQCQDTTYNLTQTIIIQNRVVAKLDESIIVADTGDASGSITLLPNCPFDTLAYEWSNGVFEAMNTGLAGGIYEVIITNEEGCMDTISFEVEGGMMDTMVMDTMVMDTMVMDTMVMDTMVMDTMVMDTMVMDTMVMDTMVMDTMVMDTMVMDTMVMDTMVMDTMVMDTMVMDTMVMDTMVMDTMVMDTMVMDTMVMDTMVMDTMVMDTMVMDTMVMDTMVMDTMVMDTMVMDTMVMDTMVMDTMVMDTMVMDTMVMDTMVMDTMVMDTMVMDTMVMDTMVMDTMVMDTMVMDTMVMDTMVMDTMVMDTMVMDTMVMDTMVMDTMVMDTMVMDTMVMDTMVMDTMVKSSLTLSITSRGGDEMTADSVYFMNSDSTFGDALIDSSGAYIPDGSLSDVAGVCIVKSGNAIDSLSVQDLTRGTRIVLRFTESCPEDRYALDVSGDNQTTAFDLALMRSILLARIDNYPNGKVWGFVKTDNGFDPSANMGSCILLDDEDRIRGSLNVTAIKLGDLKCSSE